MGSTTVPAEKLCNLLCTDGILFKQLSVYVDPVSMIINGENVYIKSPVKVVPGSLHDDIHGVPGFPVGEVVLEHVPPPAGIDQVIETGAADTFTLYEIKYPVQVLVISAGEGQPQAHTLANCKAVLKPLHGTGKRPFHPPKLVIHVFHAVKAYPHVDNTGIFDA